MKNRSIIKISLILVSIFFTSLVFSQTSTNNTENSKSKSNWPVINSIALCTEEANTYQIIISDHTIRVVLDKDVCDIVARERNDDETIYYKIDNNVTLKIYSTKELINITGQMPLIIYNK